MKMTDVQGEEEECCLICWGNLPKFGISTECSHFFCEECIKGHLNQVLESPTGLVASAVKTEMIEQEDRIGMGHGITG